MRHPLWSGWLSWLGLTLLNLGFFLGSDSYFFFLLCVLMLVLPALSLLHCGWEKGSSAPVSNMTAAMCALSPEHRPCFPIAQIATSPSKQTTALPRPIVCSARRTH